jgi:L-amino acid N-acyltransferase YncA
MLLVECNYETHSGAILDLLNEAIEHSTALYDYRPRSPESMVSWFKAKEAGRFPVVGLEGHDGELLGFASYGPFRAWPAYKYSVEHSVYVHREHRGRAIGTALMRRLIEVATDQQYHVMVAGIDVTNTVSIAMHEKLGFVHAGTIRQVGFKFGRWLDLAFYQLTLQTPDEPVEGNP